MVTQTSRLLLASAIASVLAACGGGGSATMSSAATATPPAATPQNGSMSVLLSDASTEDFATIGVKVISIALVPLGGGTNVTIYSAPTPVPITNLVLLDQLGELIGNAQVPAGSYSGAVLTVSANPGDVTLAVAADPEVGFGGSPGPIDPSNIQIQHAQGTAPNLTVPVSVNFDSSLVVSASQNNQLDLEFDLGHPAFIIGHVPPGTGTTLWAVNFTGPVHRHPLADIRRLVLRHLYGSVSATGTTSITVDKEFPTEPPVSPETAIASTQSLQILADATNGTILYDLDTHTRTVVKDFSGISMGQQLRIAARYQEDGTLVASRVWVSGQFNTVWVSPEGHVLHANAATDVVTVENELGSGVPLTVDANTQFFFRTPQNGLTDTTPIATGTAFLTSEFLVRGFKIHASVVDPLASPLVAQTIDIETARYDGKISAATANAGFMYTHSFRTASDDYAITLDYISGMTANGTDPVTGDAIMGFDYWNFAYPTLITDGTSATGSFVTATSGAVNFGGTVGPLVANGVSYAIWNDPANMNGWALPNAVLAPSNLPLSAVATGLINGAFTITTAGGTMPVTVDVSATPGAATLVYQVDRTNGILSVSPIDITMAAGMATLTNALTSQTVVKVFGVPQASGTLKAYVLTYFTGEMPAQ